jgi:hypothetical protein
VERRSLQHHIEAVLSACQHRIENWRVATYAEAMTDALTEFLEEKVAHVAAIEDPVQRGLAAREARDQLATSDRALYAIQRAAVRELKPGRTWAEVGRLFGRSHAWAEAIAAGRSAKRKKTGHVAESTPASRAVEGRQDDTTTP